MQGGAVTGVKSLVDSGLRSLPKQYVRPHSERIVATELPGVELPVIDLSSLDGPSKSQRDASLLAMHQACKEWGFFQVVNHGVPASSLDGISQLARDFFALPLEEKQKFKPQPGQHVSVGKFGTSFDPNQDAVLDWRDVLRHFFPATWQSDQGTWPDVPPLYRETVVGFRNEVTALAERLLSLMALNLGLPEHYLNEAVGACQQHVHLVYYPECPEPDLALGIKSHADSGAITLLLQDEVGGLQVSKDGRWLPVKPIPHAFVVNIGDALQAITNDAYPSVDHRAVVNGGKARLSIVTFHAPDPDHVIAPAPALISPEEGARYRSFTFGEYLRAVYAKGLDGKNVLSKFRVDHEQPS